MFWSTVALLCLLPGSWLLASEGQKPSYRSFDYKTARDHEIKPHRRTIPVDGMSQEFTGPHELHLELTVSPTGDVTHAEASGEDGDTRFWPQVEGEVYQWKFTPFKAGGKPVTATVDERVDLLPPERLPKTHVVPPPITKDSKVAIVLRQWTCDGIICALHAVSVSTDGIVFEGFNVAALGRHTDKIDKDAVLALAKRFVAADFFSMENDYRYRGWPDLTSSLSITIDGHTKSVRDYQGRWAGMPSVIVELEDEVDAVARAERWIEGSDGLVAALRAEKFDFASYYAQVILYETAARGQTTTVRELLAAGVPLKPLGEQSRCVLLQSLSVNEFCNPSLDIVANRTNLIHRTAFWIGQWPVIPAKARNVRAFVAATHGDEKGRIVCKLLGQLLWFGGAEINANLLHDRKNLWMHSQSGLGACRDSFSLSSVGKLVEESSGHL
jgi:hypothetical protein